MGWLRCCWAVLLLWLGRAGGGSGFNITTFLGGHLDFQRFNSLLTLTNVSWEIAGRSSLTVLALSNAQVKQFVTSFDGNLPMQEVADVLRYHVLLEYWGWDRLTQENPSGTLVTTLFQTTGRAPNVTGAVNLTSVGGQPRIGMPVSGARYNATISGNVSDIPYVINIVSISNMIFPFGFDVSGSPAPAPLEINVTDVLTKAHNFNFLVSLMEASGVVSELQADKAGAGITIFAPTDDAFAALKPETLQSLTADKKALILKYHVLLSYYPLGTLQTVVNPVQPTLATQAMGASSYTLNITSIQGAVALGTGIVWAPVTGTVFDGKPLAIFAIPKVLLPREIFPPKKPPPPAPELPPNRTSAPAPSPFCTPVRPPLCAPIPAPELPPFRSPASAESPSYDPPRPSWAPTTVPFHAPSSTPVHIIASPAPSVLATSPALTPYILMAPSPAPDGVKMTPPLAPSLSPSASPFGVGKISSGARAAHTVSSMAVMCFVWVLTVILLLV